MALDDDVRIQLKRSFADFLEHPFPTPDDPEWSYKQALGRAGGGESGAGAGLYTTAAEDGASDKAPRLLSRRLLVAEHHLREFDERLLLRTLRQPNECIPAFEDAVRDLVRQDVTLSKLLRDRDEIHVGLRGDFGRFEVSPRDLTSDRINQAVCVFGIVTKCSLVRPKVVKSVHYCEVTKLFTSEYRDVTSLGGLPTGAQYPTKDDNGNLLTTEYGLCTYKDSQVVTIQELPETAPPGQMPHSTEIVLEDDLVDKVKPGDRVSILGVYKAVSGAKVATFHGGVFRAVVVGIAVQKLTRENTVKVTVAEVQEIRKLAARPDVLQLLANSLAPSIYGHDIIKRGLVLQMFGGMEKNLKNGAHLRGDINCLLVGDPGVAKSQMLRACMNIAPLAVSTTGRGCSGVGLTAAVTHDNETGEKRLEAGAMVLADRGLVCIDEFDKMSDQDRVAIHEVMEQQTVTIAKAGIQCSLNARCSVLAAANPLYGSYDKAISVMRNVNLPDSLLSRFDMLFVVLDQMNDARDRQVALHVIKQHRYRPPGEDGRGAPVQETIHDRALNDEAPAAGGAEGVYVRQDARLHGGTGAVHEVLTSDFLRKYIIFARRRYAKMGQHDNRSMEIEDEALERIVEFYTTLRSKGHQERALPVTARTLETIIRLSTASAKIRLSIKISVHDVEVAVGILDHVMRKDVGGDKEEGGDEEEDANLLAGEGGEAREERPRRSERREANRRRRREDEDGDEEDNNNNGEDDEDGDEGGAPGGLGGGAAGRAARAARGRGGAGSGAMDVDEGAGPSGATGEASGSQQASKRRRTAAETAAARAALGFPAVPAPAPRAVTQLSALSAEQRKVVESCLADIGEEYLDANKDGVPVSELKAACMGQGLDVSEDVLVELLLELQASWSVGCGKPQVMVDTQAEPKNFIFVM